MEIVTSLASPSAFSGSTVLDSVFRIALSGTRVLSLPTDQKPIYLIPLDIYGSEARERKIRQVDSYESADVAAKVIASAKANATSS